MFDAIKIEMRKRRELRDRRELLLRLSDHELKDIGLYEDRRFQGTDLPQRS